jgi:hypothetical protein
MNLTTSYLDLSPLYGNDDQQQASVRTLKDGLLKPDCFYEPRLLGFPPGVSVFLLCFNRFHNYVVGQLAQINEGGKFSMPNRNVLLAGVQAKSPPGTPKAEIDKALEAAYEQALLKRDNALFQTGRLSVPPMPLTIPSLHSPVKSSWIRADLGMGM